jgi:hypothetical protein
VEDTAAISVDDRGSGQPTEMSSEPLSGAAAEPPDVRLSGLRKTYGDVVAVAAVDHRLTREEEGATGARGGVAAETAAVP